MQYWSNLSHRVEHKSNAHSGALDVEVKHGYIPKTHPNSYSTSSNS